MFAHLIPIRDLLHCFPWVSVAEIHCIFYSDKFQQIFVKFNIRNFAREIVCFVELKPEE